MKEKLYNIPINDAVNAADECPFCNIERSIEQDLMDFVLGSESSYMESDIREKTDKAGFCRRHFKNMYDYGNTLGNAWIMKTHFKRVSEEMKAAMKQFSPEKTGSMLKRSRVKGANSVSAWIYSSEDTCFICNSFKDHYDRYMRSFFDMYLKDEDFSKRVKEGKGFCLPHFADLLDYASANLSKDRQKAFADSFFPVMEKNFERLYEDVSWLVEKFDYKNKDADWKNSRDALQNCMQKLKGGYPADPVYRMKK